MVDTLLNQPFSHLSYAERLMVKQIGVHQPADFKLNVGKRSFSQKWFTQHQWLTVSLEKKKLFCFPCVLFGHSDKCWSSTGFSDIGHFARGARSHEQSEDHLSNVISLNTLGLISIDTQLDTGVFK